MKHEPIMTPERQTAMNLAQKYNQRLSQEAGSIQGIRWNVDKNDNLYLEAVNKWGEVL